MTMESDSETVIAPQRKKRKIEEPVGDKKKYTSTSKMRFQQFKKQLVEKYRKKAKLNPKSVQIQRKRKQKLKLQELENALKQAIDQVAPFKSGDVPDEKSKEREAFDARNLLFELLGKLDSSSVDSASSTGSCTPSSSAISVGTVQEVPNLPVAEPVACAAGQNPRLENDYSVEEVVMSNPLIASKVFNHLDKEDLLNMRMVNRIWNKNASLVLREKKYCVATFYFTDKDRRAGSFNKLMINSVASPFSGYSMKVSNPSSSTDEVPMSEGVIKHMEIDLKHLPQPEFESAIRCVQETLSDCCHSLEELSLISLPDQIQRFYQLFPPRHGLFNLENKFPNLRKLTVSKRQSDNPTNPKVFRDLLKASPNLQELEGDIVPQLARSVVAAKKVELVKTFRFIHQEVADIHFGMKLAQSNPKFQKLRIEECLYRTHLAVAQAQGQPQLQAEQNRIHNGMKLLMKKLLEDQDQLEFLDITELTFLKTLADGETKLKSLKRLSIRYDVILGRASYSPLQRIDFQSCFPALNLVILFLDNLYADNVHEMFLPEFEEDGELFQCLTVRKLKIVGKQCTGQLLHRMAHMFPKVIELHLAHTRDYNDIFSSLWSAWPKIKYVQADLKDIYVTQSLDSAFTGFPQNVLDEIVKTGKYHSFSGYERSQSIMNLTRLKRLVLDLQVAASTKASRGRPLRFAMKPFLNEVTWRCTLDLIPRLRVQVNTQKYEPKHYHFTQLPA